MTETGSLEVLEISSTMKKKKTSHVLAVEGS